MFLKFLANAFKNDFENLRAIYKLEQRLENPRIVRPFTIINPDRLTCGKNLLVQRNCHFHCGGRPWSKGKGEIVIGDDCWFSENNVLYGAGDIQIGDVTGTGPGVSIFSSRDNYSLEYAKLTHIVHQFGKVTIGSYVRMFANSVICPGVTIGEGAIIGAGSIVLNDIPPWSIAVGSPAKVVGKREIDTPLELRKKK